MGQHRRRRGRSTLTSSGTNVLTTLEQPVLTIGDNARHDVIVRLIQRDIFHSWVGHALAMEKPALGVHAIRTVTFSSTVWGTIMTKRILAILLSAALLACAPMAEALAASDPIPGIDIIVKKNPGGTAVTQTTTDAKGEFTLKDLEPGTYTVELVGKSLVAATAVPKARTGAPAASADGAIIAVLIGLLLPANTMAPGGKIHRDKASDKGVMTDILVSGAPGSKHSYKGRVTAER